MRILILLSSAALASYGVGYFATFSGVKWKVTSEETISGIKICSDAGYGTTCRVMTSPEARELAQMITRAADAASPVVDAPQEKYERELASIEDHSELEPKTTRHDEALIRQLLELSGDPEVGDPVRYKASALIRKLRTRIASRSL